MRSYFHNIRFYVLLISVAFSLAVYGWVARTIPVGSLQIIRLTEVYALTALTYLYVVLMIGPVVYTFPSLPWRGQIFRSRRAVGVSTFYFAFLHACLAFFGELGGFRGLQFLNGRYLWAIGLSFVALVILAAMAATSFDAVVAYLGYRRWKFLHRFIYLAGFLIVIHAFLLGSHFIDISTTIPQLFISALIVLLYFQARRVDAYMKSRWQRGPAFGVVTTLFLAAVISYLVFTFYPATSSSGLSLNIHAQHLQIAQQLQTQQTTTSSLPGLVGDPTKRYTASFLHADSIVPDKDTSLIFPIFDAANGNPVTLFTPVYTQPMHLIIVDSSLTFFSHIHPTQTEKGFEITTQFPHPGLYHLYIDFQPLGAIEQQIGFSVNVGTAAPVALPTTSPDTQLTKQFGVYDVSLSVPDSLSAAQLSLGKQQLSFTIRDASTHQPITSLQPYLGAFGHLVMINQETFDYIHVHPSTLLVPSPDATGGPTVDFLPLGLYGPITPGVYRIFAQFNPEGHLFTADFTIRIHN